MADATTLAARYGIKRSTLIADSPPRGVTAISVHRHTPAQSPPHSPLVPAHQTEHVIASDGLMHAALQNVSTRG